MDKAKKATKGQIGRIVAMLTSGHIPFDEAQEIIERHAKKKSERPKTSKPLRENEYLVHVAYDMPRDIAEFEEKFSKNGVSDLFTGNYEWQPHSSCTEIDQTPGERIMLVKHFGRDTTSEANIAEMDKLGYRPATHLEAYAFDQANPDLLHQFPIIVALGSSTVCGGRQSVAVLLRVCGGRFLDSGWFDREWPSNSRFLFVRK